MVILEARVDDSWDWQLVDLINSIARRKLIGLSSWQGNWGQQLANTVAPTSIHCLQEHLPAG